MRFAPLLLILMFAGLIPVYAAGLTRIDSVTVDSVWNSDTSLWGQPTPRRDVRLSFIPIADDSVTGVADMSLDGGKTWSSNRDLFDGVGSITSFRAAPRVKNSVAIRVFQGDTTNVAFRITARNDNVTLHQFRRAQPIANWLEKDSTYKYFRSAYELMLIMDGHYAVYFENGTVDGFFVSLVNDTLHADQYVMDCGIGQRARNTYDSVKTQIQLSRLLPVQGYPDTVAVAYRSLAGYSAYAHFRHFYFELFISGYQPADSSGIPVYARSFLDFYRQKAEMMADE
jgi:hypothetical protein